MTHTPPKQTYRIGTINVAIPCCPLPELQGLQRDPVADGGEVAVLDFRIVESPDWTPCLERGGTHYVRAVATHRCEIDFVRRHVAIRLVPQLGRVGWYLLFRDIFAALCGLSGDVFLHASSVVRGGRAAAFCAFSGGGKSTVAQLLSTETATISDEVNWVFRNRNGEFRLVDQRHYRSPPASATPDLPIAGVYILAKAPTCAVAPIAAAEAYPILLAAPFGSDPLLPARAKAAADLLADGQVRRLAFNLQPEEVQRTVWGAAPRHA